MNHAFLSCVFRAISLVFLLTVGVAAQHTILWDDLRLDLRPSSLIGEWLGLVADSSGEYRVFWTQPAVDQSEKNIIMRRFSPQGVPVGTETVIRSVPKSAECKIIGSGYGTWALLWLETINSNSVLRVQRFGADGTPRDSFPHGTGYIKHVDFEAAIDHNENVIVATQSSSFIDQPISLWYFNRTGFADSITIESKEQLSLRSISLESESRFILSYAMSSDYDIWKDCVQVYSYATNALSAVSERNIIDTRDSRTDGDLPFFVTGRCDYPGAALIGGNYTYQQCELMLLDSEGVVDADSRRLLPHQCEYRAIIAGFGGAYIVVQYNLEDHTYHAMIARSRNTNFDETVALNNRNESNSDNDYWNRSLKLDGLHRILFAYSYRKSIYLCRMGSYELPKHRVNGLDESPLRGSVAIGAGGAYRYCAWTTATADSICINGRMMFNGRKYATEDSINWYTSVPASGSTAEFGLAARADTVALAWIRSEGATLASVRLGIWKTLDNTNLNSRTLTEGGVSAQKASVTFGGDRCAVVWEQKSPSHGDTSWVYVQTMNADGSAPAAAMALSPGSSPHICAVGDSSFLVTFQYVRNVTTTVGGIPITRTVSNVYGVFINAATGQPRTDVFRLNTRPDNAYEPRGVYMSGGQTLAFWKECGVNMSTAKVFAVRIAAAGSVTGEEFRCAPLDSTVDAFDVSAAGNSMALLVWHSRTGNLVSRQFVTAHNGALSPVETVSGAAADPDVPVNVSVSASDTSALIGWLSGNHIGRDHRMFLADYLVGEHMSATSTNRTPPQQRTARSPIPVHGYGQDCFSLAGRRIKSGYTGNRQTGVYLVRQPDGTLRRLVQIRGNGQR